MGLVTISEEWRRGCGRVPVSILASTRAAATKRCLDVERQAFERLGHELGLAALRVWDLSVRSQ